MDPTEKLKATLAELHAELADAKALDPAARKALAEALAEIQHALAAGESQPTEEGPGPVDGIAQRLRKAATKFETTHPTLAGTLNRLIDLMASAGI